MQSEIWKEVQSHKENKEGYQWDRLLGGACQGRPDRRHRRCRRRQEIIFGSSRRCRGRRREQRWGRAATALRPVDDREAQHLVVVLEHQQQDDGRLGGDSVGAAVSFFPATASAGGDIRSGTAIPATAEDDRRPFSEFAQAYMYIWSLMLRNKNMLISVIIHTMERIISSPLLSSPRPDNIVKK